MIDDPPLICNRKRVRFNDDSYNAGPSFISSHDHASPGFSPLTYQISHSYDNSPILINKAGEIICDPNLAAFSVLGRLKNKYLESEGDIDRVAEGECGPLKSEARTDIGERRGNKNVT